MEVNCVSRCNHSLPLNVILGAYTGVVFELETFPSPCWKDVAIAIETPASGIPTNTDQNLSIIFKRRKWKCHGNTHRYHLSGSERLNVRNVLSDLGQSQSITLKTFLLSFVLQLVLFAPLGTAVIISVFWLKYQTKRPTNVPQRLLWFELCGVNGTKTPTRLSQ